MGIVVMMILKQLPRSCGENRVKENSMNVSTGLTDVTVSCWVIVQCLRWARVDQLMHLTTNAKPTKTARSVFVTNMVINVLASLSNTLGDGAPNSANSNPKTKLVHVHVNCSSVIFNSQKTLSPIKKFSTMTTTLSGLPLVSTTDLRNHAHQVVLIQLNINAVVVLMHHGTGLDSPTNNAVVVMNKAMVV